MQHHPSVVVVLGLLIAACGAPPSPEVPAPPTEPEGPAPLQGTITFSGAWALYPMVVKWGEEFGKLHPDVHLDVAAGGAGKGMADALAEVVDLGMVSRDVNPEEIDKGAWWVSVAKDAVVPTFNEKHPLAAQIRAAGVTREELTAIFVAPDEDALRWGLVAPGGEDLPIHVFTRSDACGAAATFAQYLGGVQEDLKGIGVYGDPGLADAVLKDPLGVGFNNVNFAYDAGTLKPVTGLAVLPLDVNGDGVITPDEDFYADRDQLAQAIGDGRYPSPPARALHLVSQGVPDDPLVRAFLAWVLSDGQQYLAESGYIPLPRADLDTALGRLAATTVSP